MEKLVHPDPYIHRVDGNNAEAIETALYIVSALGVYVQHGELEYAFDFIRDLNRSDPESLLAAFAHGKAALHQHLLRIGAEP